MRKKLLSIFLIFNIVCFQVSGAYINAYASASDIVVNGIMSEGTAMAALMSFFGITPTGAAIAAAGGVALWGLKEVEEYKRYMGAQSEYESEAVANQAAADLIDGVAHGVINTASKAYSSFRSWLKSLQTSGAFESQLMPVGMTYVPAGGKLPVFSCPNNPTYDTLSIFSLPSNPLFDYYVWAYNDGGQYRFRCMTKSSLAKNKQMVIGYHLPVEGDPDNYNWILSSTAFTSNVFGDETYYIAHFNHQFLNVNDPSDSSSYFVFLNTCPTYVWNGAIGNKEIIENMYNGAVSTGNYALPNDLLSGLSGRDKSLEDLEQQGISSTGAIGTTGTGSRSVNVDNALDVTGSSSMDKLLEKVYNKEISWSDFMDALGVATTVNTATGTQALTVDNANTATFEKAEEYVADKDFRPPVADIIEPPVYDDSNFTVSNLEEIFPFCIPFDLYDFINILAAEPQAPHWRLKASFIGRDDLYLDIDLQSWDKVAEYCRDFELLIYIIGLILVTRNLIRG